MTVPVLLSNRMIPEVAGQHFEYLDNGEVLVTLQTDVGEQVQFLMTSTTFIHSINAAVACVNQNLADIFRGTAF
jgi:hypothetical protein